MSIDEYLIFLTLFSFFEPSLLVKVLFSCVGIQSNIALSDNQIQQFFHALNPDSVNDQEVKYFLQKWGGSDRISIKSVVGLFIRNNSLSGILNEIRLSIIHNIITDKEYGKIIRRKTYYNQLQERKIKLERLPVSCKEQIRYNLTGEPPVFHTDYRALNQQISVNPSMIILSLRGKYGYSKRLLGSSVCSSSSFKETDGENIVVTAENCSSISKKYRLRNKAHSDAIIDDSKISSPVDKNLARSIHIPTGVSKIAPYHS